MPKLQFSKGRWSITVPFEIVQQNKWEKGQGILLVFNERGNVELKELETPAKK
jgi:hypothetical protein